MLFPALVADRQQSGIAIRFMLILKGRAHHARVCFARLQTQIVKIACDKTAG
jgi:hypothetical protein